MPYEVIDLNPVDRITTDAVGEPGNRVFYIQARKGKRLVTVICEKEHVTALAVAAEQVLLSLAGGDADAVVEPDPAIDGGMVSLPSATSRIACRSCTRVASLSSSPLAPDFIAWYTFS